MGIVGHKTESYLIAERVFDKPWTVTRHVIVTELHATKGWRKISHQRRTHVRTRLPSIKEWRLNDVTKFEWIRRRERSIPGHRWIDMERARMRHAWYRRQKEREARAAAKEAWNNV